MFDRHLSTCPRLRDSSHRAFLPPRPDQNLRSHPGAGWNRSPRPCTPQSHLSPQPASVSPEADVCRILAGSVQHRWKGRSEEHTSELQSLMRSSYAVFCLKKKTKTKHIISQTTTYAKQ